MSSIFTSSVLEGESKARLYIMRSSYHALTIAWPSNIPTQGSCLRVAKISAWTWLAKATMLHLNTKLSKLLNLSQLNFLTCLQLTALVTSLFLQFTS